MQLSRFVTATKTCPTNNTVGKRFKKRRHQSDSVCQLPPKKPNIDKKTNNFLTPSVSKKVKFVKFGVKKANLATLGSRGGLHSLFHLLTCE